MSRRSNSPVLVALVASELLMSAAGAACPGHLGFLGAKCAQWQADVLPTSLPPARGNAFADSDAAAALGMKIFYDNRFSKVGSGVACVNCHDPEHAFAEKKRTSHTIGDVFRNAPDLLNAAWYTTSHFWDGKVDNLWSAPLFTLEQEAEMGSTRLRVVHTLATIYRIRYEKIFGPLPDLSDTSRFPLSGKPGTPDFDRMTDQDKAAVNQVYANVGKALEAYIRKLAAGRSRFDDFMNGQADAISIDAQRGMGAFSRNGCDSCHSGPLFSDEQFHTLNYRFHSASSKDPARAGGMAIARTWQFNLRSQFADPTNADQPVAAATVRGQLDGFRTPSLRNLELSYPYGHDGEFDTLEQAIDAHAGILPNHAAPNAQDEHDIIEFIRTLRGRPPQPPWNYWPGG
jgi:cytochrome c peroxidase